MQKEARKGFPSALIRRYNGSDLLPQQFYNVIRKDKDKIFENEIKELFEFTQTLKNDYDVLWKETEEHKFYSLLVVNSKIRMCAYSNDIVVLDDTECTNHFHYPFLCFLVFDENNKVQILAIGIITSKEEDNFVDILESLKTLIPEIRVMIVDRLQSQKNAIQKVYNNTFIVFCRIHIARNIKNKMGKDKTILKSFWEFINKKIKRDEFVKRIEKQLEISNSVHLRNLLNDINHYDPYILRDLNLKKHFTTNSVEGNFGNIKRLTDHKFLPLYMILKMFVDQAMKLMKTNIIINSSPKKLDPSIYSGRDLGTYCVTKIEKRYHKCLELISRLNHEDKTISSEAEEILFNCNCKKDDIICIHSLYKRIISKPKNEPLIKEEEIPNKYKIHNIDIAYATENRIIIVISNREEKWEFNTIMDRVKIFADLAQRYEPARKLFRNFFEEAEKIKKDIDPMANKVIKTPGAQPSIPSATVNRYGTKHGRRCSICHEPGHYASTCKHKK